MDSQHSDSLTRFQEAARRGDWVSAGKLMAEIKRASFPSNLPSNLPTDAGELGEYLPSAPASPRSVARASRAAAAATLSRLTAVAKFSRAVATSPDHAAKIWSI